MDKDIKKIAKEFKDNMQKVSDKDGTTISMSFNGEEHIISKPKDVEEIGATALQKPQFAPLHLACGDDELRPNLHLIKIASNIATATNGNIMVKIDLSMCTQLDEETLKTLHGKNIHKETWKEIHKADMVQFFEDQIDVHNKGIKKTFYYQAADGVLWDDGSIIIPIKEAGEEAKRIVMYNPKYIGIIAKIFQEEQMIFSFSANNKGTIVFPSSESGMFAVLMPMESSHELNRYLFY